MPRLGEFKNYTIKLTGLMDTRSSPDELPPGYFRLNKNLNSRSTSGVCRLPGWSGFLLHDDLGTAIKSDNSDLHDQLVRKVVGYDDFDFTIPGSSSIAGQSYPYQFPDTVTAGSYVQEDYSTTHLGYAFTTPIDWLETARFRHPARDSVDGLFIREFFIGYPFFEPGGWSGTTEDASYRITSSTPYEAAESHYYTSFVDWTDGSVAEGYPYGEPTNIYTATPDSTYGYCGTELHYRNYCDTYFEGYKGREAVTLLYEFSSGAGSRKLIAGTQSRIYASNNRAHNWRIIADGLGGADGCECGTGRRFHVAQLGNILVFTNDYDKILYWTFDSAAQDCELQSAQPIPELVELEVNKASVVVEYKGFIFLMNVELGGTRHIGKAIWSDYAGPLSYLPSNESLAGDSDIGNPGEGIIEAKVLGDYLFVFKERSVWRITLVDPDNGLFNIQQVYKGESTPRFRNTIVSTGDALYYFGFDTIYKFDLFSQFPKEEEWMHLACGMVFDENLVFSSDNLVGGIEESECDHAVAGWDATRKQLWFSWVSRKNSDSTSVAETTQSGFNPLHSVDCPNRSMVFNMRYHTSSYVDHGFTAFVGYRQDTRPALKDWLAELCVCDIDEDWGDSDRLKEGEPYYSDLEISCDAAPEPDPDPDPDPEPEPEPEPDPTLMLDACAWWKADSFTTLSDGDPVGGAGVEWEDQATTKDAAQANAAARPLFKTNIFGTKPAIRFDGVDDCLIFSPDLTFTSGVVEFTIAVVYKHNSASDGMLMGFQGLSYQFLSRASNNTLRAYDLATLFDSAALASAPSTTRAVFFRNKQFVAGEMLRENTTNLGPLTQSNTGFRFDTIGSTNGALFLNGDIAEIIVICRIASDGELIDLYDDYFKIRYPELP